MILNDGLHQMVSRVLLQPSCSLSQWQVKDMGAEKNRIRMAKPLKLGQSPRQVCYFRLNFGRLKKHLQLSAKWQVLSREYRFCRIEQRDSLGCGSRGKKLPEGWLNLKLTLLLIPVVRWWAMRCKSNLWPTNQKHSSYDYFLHSFIRRTPHASMVCFIPKTQISPELRIPRPLTFRAAIFSSSAELCLASCVAWGGPRTIKSLYSLPHFQMKLFKRWSV